MKILVKQPKDKKTTAEKFTFPMRVCRLTPRQVKKMGFTEPLLKLAQQLVKQGPDDALGIEVDGVSFAWILDPSKKEKR